MSTITWAGRSTATSPTSGSHGNLVAVTYPAQFAPVTGTTTFDDSVDIGVDNLGSCLDADTGGCDHNDDFGDPQAPGPATHFAIYGYSQSAVVASLVKNGLIHGSIPTTNLDGTEFYLISNPYATQWRHPRAGITRDSRSRSSASRSTGPSENSFFDYRPHAVLRRARLTTSFTPTVDVAHHQYDFLGRDAPDAAAELPGDGELLLPPATPAHSDGNVQNHTLDEAGNDRPGV